MAKRKAKVNLTAATIEALPLPEKSPKIYLDGKRWLSGTQSQLDGVKFHGRRSSIWPCGWPAAMASRVALR